MKANKLKHGIFGYSTCLDTIISIIGRQMEMIMFMDAPIIAHGIAS